MFVKECKSVKNVVGKISVIYCNSVIYEIIENLLDRRLTRLKEHFSPFSLEGRQQVKTAVVDINTAYFTLTWEPFSNYKVIIDRFHVVQLIFRILISFKLTQKAASPFLTKLPK